MRGILFYDRLLLEQNKFILSSGKEVVVLGVSTREATLDPSRYSAEIQQIRIIDPKGRIEEVGGKRNIEDKIAVSPKNNLPGLYKFTLTVADSFGGKRELSGGFWYLPSARDKHPPFSFVHITDVHVSASSDTVQTFAEDIKEINSLAKKPSFLVNTGDLVTSGKNDQEFGNYQKAASESEFPLCNLIGNEDAQNGIGNYVKFIGPDYYSFDFNQKHFIALDCVDSFRYAEWLREELKSQPKKKSIIVFQHYPPDKSLLELLSRYNTKALFYGHHHSNKVFYYGKILVASTPPLMGGGIDCSPRGFRVVTFDKKERLTTEYRWSGVSRQLSVVSPVGDVTSNSETVPMKFNAHDTASNIKNVLYRIDGGSWKETARVGGWLWQADQIVKQISGGAHILKVRVIPEAGAVWEKEERFRLTVSQTSPLIWNRYAGGETGMSAPVVENGRLYIGVQDDDNAQNGGVVCLDGANGKVVWKFKTGCSVNGTPAVTEGIVCAVSVVGTVYALDAASGKELWRYDLGNPWERWVYNSPVVSGGTVYCGVASYFVALDLKTGEKLWHAQPMGSDFASSHTSPTIDDKNVYIGFNAQGGLFALNRQTGSIVWNKKEGLAATNSSPVVCNGTVYYTSDEKLYAFKKKTGKELWRAKLAGGWMVSSPAVKDSTLVVGSPDGKILAFDTQTGRRLWFYQTKTAIGSFSDYKREGAQVMSSPVISGNKVYVGSNDGRFYVLNLKKGEGFWSYNLGVPILSSPAVSGNIVYVATYDGNIYAFVRENS